VLIENRHQVINGYASWAALMLTTLLCALLLPLVTYVKLSYGVNQQTYDTMLHWSADHLAFSKQCVSWEKLPIAPIADYFLLSNVSNHMVQREMLNDHIMRLTYVGQYFAMQAVYNLNDMQHLLAWRERIVS
jgi:hypothetical protein